jgi:hypothetical protein
LAIQEQVEEEEEAPPLSQPRPESDSEDAEEDEGEQAIENIGETEVGAKDVIEASSDEEPEDEAVDTEAVGNDEEAELEDDFAGFDVTPEDKEFSQACWMSRHKTKSCKLLARLDGSRPNLSRKSFLPSKR